MHVLQVTPYFPPTWAYGGIPRIVDGLSRALIYTEDGTLAASTAQEALLRQRRPG
jgi:hypothetical protein